jgi:ferrous iron transport protein A
MTLAELRPGQVARVTEVRGEGPFRRRLLELGLLPGTSVLRTAQSPFGDPLSFRVRGAVLCLRRCDAESIGIEP